MCVCFHTLRTRARVYALCVSVNMCSYVGDSRPWCYTRLDMTAYGYCDCERDEIEWTRPVGHLPNFHNVGPASGGDVYVTTSQTVQVVYLHPRCIYCFGAWNTTAADETYTVHTSVTITDNSTERLDLRWR